MKRYDGLLGCISIVVVVAMFISLGSVLLKSGVLEPDNPLGTGAELLTPEALENGTGMEENKNPEETEPEETQSEETQSEETQSEETQSEETQPEETQPEETQPEETQPEETQPEETQPEETQPEETQPEETQPEETQPEDTPSEPWVDQNGNQTGGSNSGTENGGNSDSGENGDATAGVPDGGDGNQGGNTPGSGENDTPKIVTDIRSQQISRLELPDGFLRFYAYPSQNDGTYSVKVVVNHSGTPVNGQTLTSSDGIHYDLTLPLNETTNVTLYLKHQGENVSYVRYQIRYEMEKATEENPEVGTNPPSIVTNLDGFTGKMETQDFVFWVSARTNPEGNPIYSNQIEVWLNGELVPKQTGDSRPEYELHFEPPNVGDDAQYTVKVRAWDSRGNSTMKVYTLQYHTVSEGDYLGRVRLVLDATTVGLGIVDTAEYEIVQGDNAAGVVLRFLEEYGYEAVYDGNATTGFYLRSISRGDLCANAKVPDNLWNLILRDGIQLSGYSDRDQLGEYDYTMGSGWMYSIDGTVYPGRGLSDYQLSSNTTIYLRFTLAYGKDVGGYDATGSGYGSLSSYCGVWVGGTYTPLEHSYVETGRLEPTQTEDGYVDFICEKCGETKQELLPRTGDAEEPEESETRTESEEKTDFLSTGLNVVRSEPEKRKWGKTETIIGFLGQLS